jgi:hypothetical protein
VRRLVFTGAALAALVPAGIASATTPPDSPPESTVSGTTADTAPTPTESAAPAGTSPEPELAAETATVYDESGNPVAAITVIGTETGWSDYQEGDEPDEGRDYVRVVVNVDSLITEGTFGISVGDFILQSNNGFVTTAENVLTAAQAEAGEEVTEEADLANGESVELTLTFQVVGSVGPQSVFYRPDDDRLVDVAEFS